MMDGTYFIKILLDSLSNLNCVIDSTVKKGFNKDSIQKDCKIIYMLAFP